MGIRVGSASGTVRVGTHALEIRVLGPIAVSRAGATVPLPRSRKVRALLAYLALSRSPVSRSRLCDLLWDVPNDPRGELRWCLSKLRGVLDDADRRRVVTRDGDQIALDLSDCRVDAREIEALAKGGIASASTEDLTSLCGQIPGELLGGTHVGGNPEFSAWLAAEREHYRNLHVGALAALAERALPGSEESLRRLEDWLRVSPFDQRAHDLLLTTLLRAGRVRDAEEHVARAIRSFEQEGLDWTALRDSWHAIRRATAETPPRIVEPSIRVQGREAAPSPGERRARLRASVAVMPFSDDQAGPADRVADGLAEDIITRLAKLRVLFVIARGTVFSLRERGIGAGEAGRILGVEYVVTGKVRRHGSRMSVVVELAETDGARIVWTDEFDAAPGDAFAVMDAIV
ncbi:MAG TPA: BTAD domain-containing putative transcriptional regulator, partial [Polyangiaceae bacterium]|nr:BTAD domain-containing putative transcriptional regulator [Polyangiaceae bacterium]